MPETVVAVVLKDGKILMIERRDVPGTRAAYVFPGGKVEAGEALSAAAEREVLEETGLYCVAEREIAKRVHPTTRAKIHYWLCRYLNPKAGATPEFPVVWTGVEYLDSLAGSTLFPVIKRELMQAEYA
jgi:8-oxo-dGTP diphosphatase